jgi:putative transposase
MSATDLAGWLAASLTFCSFACRDMLALRMLAVLANLAFMAYGAIAGLVPVLVLHMVLLPLNVRRLLQGAGLDAGARAWAAQVSRATACLRRCLRLAGEASPGHGRFTEQQMVAMLREAERTSVAEVARKYQLSEQTIDGWRHKFDAMAAAGIERLRELQRENARLKRMLAEQELTIDMLEEISSRR